jgi:hypothetical protein
MWTNTPGHIRVHCAPTNPFFFKRTAQSVRANKPTVLSDSHYATSGPAPATLGHAELQRQQLTAATGQEGNTHLARELRLLANLRGGNRQAQVIHDRCDSGRELAVLQTTFRWPCCVADELLPHIIVT